MFYCITSANEELTPELRRTEFMRCAVFCLPNSSSVYLLFIFFLFVFTVPIESSLLSQKVLRSGPEVIKLFSCSTQLSTKFFLLINVKMPTIVGILRFMSGKNSILGLFEPIISQIS